ncbi:hypothetical protein HDU67_001826 [Dinochytrium kinnereticum]|nr:hypothetical protein HDU67_001826 [Dinochytrium kinnereticum]
MARVCRSWRRQTEGVRWAHVHLNSEEHLRTLLTTLHNAKNLLKYTRAVSYLTSFQIRKSTLFPFFLSWVPGVSDVWRVGWNMARVYEDTAALKQHSMRSPFPLLIVGGQTLNDWMLGAQDAMPRLVTLIRNTYAHITHLCIDESLGRFFENGVLRGFPQLVVLRGISVDETTVESFLQVSLPSLRHLEIEFIVVSGVETDDEEEEDDGNVEWELLRAHDGHFDGLKVFHVSVTSSYLSNLGVKLWTQHILYLAGPHVEDFAINVDGKLVQEALDPISQLYPELKALSIAFDSEELENLDDLSDMNKNVISLHGFSSLSYLRLELSNTVIDHFLSVDGLSALRGLRWFRLKIACSNYGCNLFPLLSHLREVESLEISIDGPCRRSSEFIKQILGILGSLPLRRLRNFIFDYEFTSGLSTDHKSSVTRAAIAKFLQVPKQKTSREGVVESELAPVGGWIHPRLDLIEVPLGEEDKIGKLWGKIERFAKRRGVMLRRPYARKIWPLDEGILFPGR